MTPLMHFIIQRDITGVRMVANSYKPDDRNILGHNCLNLLCIIEDPFMVEAVQSLDDKLYRMMDTLSSKQRKNKFGNIFMKGLDAVTTTIGSFGGVFISICTHTFIING